MTWVLPFACSRKSSQYKALRLKGKVEVVLSGGIMYQALEYQLLDTWEHKLSLKNRKAIQLYIVQFRKPWMYIQAGATRWFLEKLADNLDWRTVPVPLPPISLEPRQWPPHAFLATGVSETSVVRTSEGRPAPWWYPGWRGPENSRDSACSCLQPGSWVQARWSSGEEYKAKPMLTFANYITNSRHCSLCKHRNLLLIYQQNHLVASGRTPPLHTHDTMHQQHGIARQGPSQTQQMPPAPQAQRDKDNCTARASGNALGCSPPALLPMPLVAAGAGDALQQLVDALLPHTDPPPGRGAYHFDRSHLLARHVFRKYLPFTCPFLSDITKENWNEKQPESWLVITSEMHPRPASCL